jgi:undecaprenyl phosphate-alpha-L-ara4N flippase subunit ArnE
VNEAMINILPWLLLLIVVVTGTTAQLSLKLALQGNNSSTPDTHPVKSLLYSIYFWTWLACYILVTVLWLFVLRTIPLSQAFPALGLTFALVPLASHYLLHERIFSSQWLGIIVIVVGAILVVQR